MEGKNGKLFINGEEIGPIENIDITSNDDKSTKYLFLPEAVSITGTFKIKWKDKIQKSLGFNHGVKNNRLYRKHY